MCDLRNEIVRSGGNFLAGYAAAMPIVGSVVCASDGAVWYWHRLTLWEHSVIGRKVLI